MKRLVPVLHGSTMITVILASILLSGCQMIQQQAGSQPSPTAAPATNESTISATGKVMPARWASLSFGTSGLVREVLVREGETVSQGQTLAGLDLPEAQAALAQAEAAVQTARAQLVRLQAAPRPVDLHGAEIAIEMARNGQTAAQVALEATRANISATEAAVDVALASLRKVQAGATADELEVARQSVDLARNRLYAAQGQRDAMGAAKQLGAAQPGSYEAAKGEVLAAETGITIAEIQYRILAAGARAEDIGIARTQVAQAQAAVEVARAQQHAAEQQAASSGEQVRQAQAQLDLLQAPAREEDLAIARTQVAQAEAAVQAAKTALEKAELRAPFAGTVTEVSLRAGEYVMMGTPVISLGDLGTLRVETTDLDEIDVARVAEGQKVAVTLDALPGARFGGTVREIALKAGAGGGGTTYRVIISFDEGGDPRLRWGMTAFADIAP